MKFYFSLLFMVFFLYSCQDKSMSAIDVANQQCECFKSVDDAQAYADCNSPLVSIVIEHRSDTAWSSAYKEQFRSCLNN
tara:strand:+ start:359 stop:595 length:237 start_codon:yes stop_codon:yes gene_type:complete